MQRKELDPPFVFVQHIILLLVAYLCLMRVPQKTLKNTSKKDFIHLRFQYTTKEAGET